MLTANHIETYGWEAAIRGMRNPMNSWENSDSKYIAADGIFTLLPSYSIGKNDMELMEKLVAAGPDHSKFMRMIGISMDIKAPLYWWKEFDTYKVGTVANSCSTMHKIHDFEFTIEDFSHEHMNRHSMSVLLDIIIALNLERERFNATHDKDHWWQLIQLLPSSYNQKRTVLLNYAVARNIYRARKNHKLDEWKKLCEILANGLPCHELITGCFTEDEKDGANRD